MKTINIQKETPKREGSCRERSLQTMSENREGGEWRAWGHAVDHPENKLDIVYCEGEG